MSRINGLLRGVALMAALGVTVVFACGPFFGIEALQGRRDALLLAPPTVSFEAELKALNPAPKDKLPVVEINERGEDPPDPAAIDAKELPPAVLERVSAMRSQNSGESAYAMGHDLPPAIQLYTAGAVGFSHGDNAAAGAYFQKILDLPEQERKSREVWAHFMLGRIALQESNQSEAAAQFETVRALVKKGAADPLGLAVASLGEQAGGAWKQGALANAVELYARQASYGSQSGANSLVMLAARILDDRNLLEQGVRDGMTRRLLFICLNANSGRLFFVGPDTSDGGAAKVDRLVAALESQGLTHVAGAGLLASAAYSQGRFDVAQKLSALEDVSISFWVQAKLALRRGDSGTALTDYDKALKTFQPSMGDSASMMAEYGVLRVSRADYVQALDLFNRATAKGWGFVPEYDGFTDYWGDAAYLAERVLTIDELRDYLSHQLPGRPDSEISRLRSVLARRLMRMGRRQEALRYFDDARIRSKAEQYNSALNTAHGWWHLPLTRAEAWFTAAKLARDSGLEILGFEKEPDYAIWNGEFEFNGGEDAKPGEDERKRVAASKPDRDIRFQYRLTAVDQATKSADFLPARSQPFAAVLCQATEWVIDREPDRANQLYRRYLHQGAHVAWGRTFGRSCPQPDFAEASIWSDASRRVIRLGRHARAHPLYAPLATGFAAAILTALIVFARRARQRPPRRVNGG